MQDPSWVNLSEGWGRGTVFALWTAMFDTELRYFIAHQDELVAKHQGKTLVIRGEHVEGAYAAPLDAYVAVQKQFAPGTFMLQPCEPGPLAYTVTISSMNL